MTYLLDANTFMEAARSYYSFRLAPGYWDWLVEKYEEGHIASAQAILDEINAGTGDLVTWAADPAISGFWLPDTAASLSVASELATWANNPDRPFKQSAVDEFMASGDLRLISQAATLNATIVTRETSDPNCRKRVKLPDAAGSTGVACMQPFRLYEQLGLSLS